MAARCPFGRHPELGGPWVPAFAGKTKRVGKRGPRSHGGAAITAQTSAQRGFHRRNAQVLAPFVSPAKAGAQEPRWRRSHRADLSAVGFPPAGCPGALEKPALSVPRRPWRLDVLLAAIQSSVAPGSRRSPGKRRE